MGQPARQRGRSDDAALHDAILEALFSGGVLSDEALQRLLGEPADGDQEGARQQIEDLIQQIIERMMEQGFITGAPDLEEEREHRRGSGGGTGGEATQVTFEVTDKALDFLGYRALRDLLGSIGRSSAGRHDTHHLSTGVEPGGRSLRGRRYAKIDPSSTILNACRVCWRSDEDRDQGWDQSIRAFDSWFQSRIPNRTPVVASPSTFGSDGAQSD